MFVEALVTFLIVLAGIWFLTEVLQGIWYESVVGQIVPRVALAAVIFTTLQLYFRIRLESLMDASLPWVIVSGIIWAVVFYGLFQFSAGHALGLGVGGMLILTCLSGMVSDGFRGVGAVPARPAVARARPPVTPKRMPRTPSGFAPFQVPSIDSRGTAKAETTKAAADPQPGQSGAEPVATPSKETASDASKEQPKN
ncbi:hypothetical protein GC170_00660 [bacterium]|nr:hypothetical protein [bacterium]